MTTTLCLATYTESEERKQRESLVQTTDLHVEMRLLSTVPSCRNRKLALTPEQIHRAVCRKRPGCNVHACLANVDQSSCVPKEARHCARSCDIGLITS